MKEELKESIISAYKEYLEGEVLEDSTKSIERYVSTLYYDLLDDIELNKELFNIDSIYIRLWCSKNDRRIYWKGFKNLY